MSKQPIKEDFVSREEQAERSARRKGLTANQEVLAEASNDANNADEDQLNVPADTEEELEEAEVLEEEEAEALDQEEDETAED